MKARDLRRKYSEFIYETFDYSLKGKNLEIRFIFRIPPDFEFQPSVVIENIDEERIKFIGEDLIKNLIFNLGLIEMFSYWKVTASPKIVIKAGPLNPEQVLWWEDLLFNGFGQFFYENRINFKARNFVKIVPKRLDNTYIYGRSLPKGNEKMLVPIGGGKDSITTLEILKKNRFDITCFSLNPRIETEKIMKFAGCKQNIIVRRNIDSNLLKLNKMEFLNGHVPFSAYLAFLSFLCAELFGLGYIAVSNERSSDEGNTEYLGTQINHQYSKSSDFENKFRQYASKYLAKNVEYFSFLRPLYEIQIAELFSKLPRYFGVFLSCNESRKISCKTKTSVNKWCGVCPKCLFVFLILYPFINERDVIKIFGKNLFEDKKLLPILETLIGEKSIKPFECVGTKKEVLSALYLGVKKQKGRAPFLLDYFRNNFLDGYPDIESETKSLLNSWYDKNNLPELFKEALMLEFNKRK